MCRDGSVFAVAGARIVRRIDRIVRNARQMKLIARHPRLAN